MKSIQPKDRIWLLLILISAACTILLNNLDLWPMAQYVTLPLTTLFIIILAVHISRENEDKLFNRLIIGALVASLLGDATLQFGHINKKFFIMGVSFFLMAQIIYAFSFWIHNRFHKKDILPLIFFFIYGSTMYIILNSYIPEIKYLILAYITVICSMGWRASSFFYRANFSPLQKILVLAGALLFIISDSILSVKLFITPLPLGNLLVLVPYYLAQTAFALSMRKYTI